MEYRSSNAGQHHSGSLVAGVGSSHAVEIGGGSTGGVVQAVGDDSNITLTLRGKGTGGVVLGNSSQGLTLGGGSTTAIAGFRRVRVDFTVPELAALAAGASTHTAVGLTTNAVMMFNTDALAAVVPNTVSIRAKCSTTDELRLIFQNDANSTIGTGLSTSHGYLGWFTF